MKTIEIDLTKLSRLDGVVKKYKNDAFNDCVGAIVRPVVRYREEDELLANELIAELVRGLRDVARYVRRVERHVTRKSRERIDGYSSDMAPVQAVKKFVEGRGLPDGLELGVVESEIRKLLKDVPHKVVSKPRSVCLSGIGVVDFMPFYGPGDVKIDGGVVCVSAEYVRERGRSNRAGKSSLFDAIEFALFGKTGRGVRNDKYIHNGQDSCSVAVDLEYYGSGKSVSGKQITRKVTKSGSSLVVDGCDSDNIGDNQLYIEEEILGMRHDDFIRSCFIRQGDLYGLLTDGGSMLSKTLSGWLGLDVWTAVHKKVVSEYKWVDSEYNSVSQKIESIKDELKKIEYTENDVRVIEGRYNELKETLVRAKNAKGEIDNIGKTLELGYAAVDFDAKREEIPDLIKKIEKEESAAEKYEKQMSELGTGCALLEKNALELRERVSDGFDGVCPIDQCECPRTDEINGDCGLFKEQLRVEEDKIKELRNEISRIKHDKFVPHRDAALEYSGVIRKLDRDEEIYEGVERIRKDSKRGKEILAEIDKLEKLSCGLPDIVNNVSVTSRELDDAKYSVRRVKELNSEIERLSDEYERLRPRVDLYTYLHMITGPGGIPSVLLESAIGVLESTSNEILGMQGTEHRLEFSFETETKKAADTCRKCGHPFPRSTKVKKCERCGNDRGKHFKHELSVQVVENGERHDFSMDSGGGCTLLAFAFRVALSQFLGAPFLFLDEIDGRLDSVNLASFISLVQSLVTNSRRFDQVFIISHRPEVMEAFDGNGVVVTRDSLKGRSYLSNR